MSLVAEHSDANVQAEVTCPVPIGRFFSVKHGFAFDGKFFADSGSHVVLTPGNFHEAGGFKAKADEKWFTGPIPSAYVLKRGDLVVAMTEQSEGLLGSAAVVPEDDLYLHNQRLGLIQVKPGAAIDKRYLYYLFNSADVRRQIQVTASGTKIRHTSPGRIEAVTAIIPSLPEQIRIGEILGSLDDKIEVNRRMNQTLEELARATFRAWFVDFLPVKVKIAGATSFPGMDPTTFAALPTEMVETQHGEVPKGWRRCPIPEAFELNPPRTLRHGEAATYLDMKNMPTSGPSASDWIQREFTGSGMKFCNGDTLVARITPCLENGKTAYVDFLEDGETAWGSTEYLVLRPKAPLPTEFGYLLAREEDFREFAVRHMSGTSGRQRFSASSLSGFFIAAPTEAIARAFAEQIGAYFRLIKAQAAESRTLAATRDLLLPRLLSGGP